MAARTATTKSAETAPTVETLKNGNGVDNTMASPVITETAPTARIKFDAPTLAKIKTAPAWRPADGDTITGRIVTILKREGEFGPYPCIILKPGTVGEDGKVTYDESAKFVAAHGFHGVLQNELKDMKAKPGDEITVLYTGKRTANKLNADGSEKNYHGYSVVPTDGAELDVFDF